MAKADNGGLGDVSHTGDFPHKIAHPWSAGGLERPEFAYLDATEGKQW